MATQREIVSDYLFNSHNAIITIKRICKVTNIPRTKVNNIVLEMVESGICERLKVWSSDGNVGYKIIDGVKSDKWKTRCSYNMLDLPKLRMQQMYDGGMSIRQIALYFGVTFKTASRRINAHRKKTLLIDEIRRMYESGMTVNAIARHFKVTNIAIQKRVNNFTKWENKG